MTLNWIEKLEKLNKEFQVCVGIDPIPSQIDQLKFNSIYEWCEFVINNTSDNTQVYKLQMAYFEQSGIPGLTDLKKVINYIKNNFPQKIIIGDSKRSDIGSTASAYADAMYSYWGYDVATVNPYMGSDSILPFAEKNGAFVICKTSNPGSDELQNLLVENIPIYKKVLEIVENIDSNNNLGVVIGATFPSELRKIRSENKNIPILIPGLGFQGGDLEKTIKASKGNGFNIINSSRGICFPNFKVESRNQYKSFISNSLEDFIKNIYMHV